MDFRDLNTLERQKLYKALRGNAENNSVLLMDENTSFIGSKNEIGDEEVINAICSVPCHY